eukprot:GEMP01062185.1.p1 GENE.GEMP01062185.1~~GEMP01062185.1.p1  ORF type:complete len:185 (+),score=8.78 GEMP01062185.1:71-625(+)
MFTIVSLLSLAVADATNLSALRTQGICFDWIYPLHSDEIRCSEGHQHKSQHLSTECPKGICTHELCCEQRTCYHWLHHGSPFHSEEQDCSEGHQRKSNLSSMECPNGICTNELCCERTVVINKGDDGCSIAQPCNLCEGDCDVDADCKGSLKCYQRFGNEKSDFGCGITGLQEYYDYCHEPLNL